MSGVSNKQNSDQQKVKSGFSRTVGKTAVKLVIMIIILMSVAVGFVLTPWGAKVAIDSANNMVDELTIEYARGGLGSELTLSSVTWKQHLNQVEIVDLRLSLQLSCLWRLGLCIDSVSSDKMAVQVQTNQDENDSESDASTFTLPFPVSVKNITLGEFSLKVVDEIQGESQKRAGITWQNLTAKLDFYQRLRIEMLQIDGFNLKTYDLEEEPMASQAKAFDWTTWQYQGISPLPIVLPLHFDVLALNMFESEIQLAGQKQVDLNKITLQAKGNAKKIQLLGLSIEHEFGQLTAKGNVQLEGYFDHQLSVNANTQMQQYPPLNLTLRSSGDINSVTTQLELRESSQSAVSRAHTPKLEIKITAQPTKPLLPLNLQIDWQHLFWPLFTEPKVKSDAGSAAISGDLSALQLSLKTRLSGQDVPEAHINLEANAIATAQQKTLKINELLLETLDGQLQSQGSLHITDYIQWQGLTRMQHLDPSTFWPELVADINGELSTQLDNKEGVWKAKLGKLNIDGQWQGYPLSMSGSVDYHQRLGLQLHALTLKNADNTLLLDGKISEQQQLNLELSIDAAELSNSLPQLGGSLNVSGSLTRNVEQPEFSYELSGKDLLFSEVLVQQAEGKGAIKWDQQKSADLNLTLTGIQGINNQIDSAQVVLKGDASAHQLDVTTNGQSKVNLGIQGQLKQSSWEGKWITGDVQTTYANLALSKPFEISADWSNHSYVVAPHCWEHSNNKLCVKLAEFKNNILSWDVSLREFDVLSVISRLMPEVPDIDTKSRLNLDMTGNWDSKSLPNVDLSARLSPADWVFSRQNNLKLSLNETLIKAQLTPKNIVANINVSGNEIGTLSANLEGQSGVYTDPLARPIQGELMIERLDLAALKVLLPQLDVLQGSINGQANIDGTLGTPLLTGELNLANGALKDETLPVALSEIQQNIKLQGQKADFAGSYKLGKGQGQMDGEISWTPELKGKLNIVGEALEFDYQSMVKASVSPDMSIIFEPNNVELKGEVTVPYARIKVRELPKDTISPSKDVILVEQQAQRTATQQRLALNVLLKVDPLSSNNVKLDAFGLTTDLRGQLRLQNNKADIFGSGEVQLVNGRYRAYGQNLIIREGDILFTNSLERPFLNIEAVRDPELTSDGVIAGLRVEGVAQNPSISVFSEPVMEQQQILSYMLTGRGMGESNGDSQDTILANALLSLGLGQSENLISKVGNKLGFEDVNLDTTGQGDETQLSLTGTIAPGVQLRYGVGVFDSISEVAIRYELLPKLYIEAVSGVSNAIDIYYQFSIEGNQDNQQNND
ncbi:MAG: translocation/assembly module TamB domain-containing protein [Paraglaciecola sp.]|uniref:autotransporter assembly complex protein TamB n=1 Tax=Paraglaciecola sp. TaxID=1920173 RepID=UPI003297BE12